MPATQIHLRFDFYNFFMVIKKWQRRNRNLFVNVKCKRRIGLLSSGISVIKLFDVNDPNNN